MDMLLKSELYKRQLSRPLEDIVLSEIIKFGKTKPLHNRLHGILSLQTITLRSCLFRDLSILYLYIYKRLSG